MDKAIFKFNSGQAAILCSKCRTIIKTGRWFNVKEDMAAFHGGELEAQYCEKCITLHKINKNA